MAYETDSQAETPKKERRPVTGERAFEETDEKKHRKIVEYVNAKKAEYFDAPEYKAYMAKVSEAKLLINQDVRGLETRMKLRFGLMRAGYDNLVDALDDLFDVDDLVTCRPDGSQEEGVASAMQAYLNRMLRSIHHHEHLSERFLYIPDYGWSIAHDSYQFSDGWVVKPQAKTVLPGFEGFDFGMEEDIYMDRPTSEIVRPDHWFGAVDMSGRSQQFQGTLKRWYLRDVLSAMERKDKAGKALYNLRDLDKLSKLMEKGHQDADQYYKLKEDMGDMGKDVVFDTKNRNRAPYVDIVRFHGPLNEISDSELAKDPNEYYVECTRSCLLRWQENPRDRFTNYTHGRSYPYRNNPFSRSYLDTTKTHQIFNDFLVCTSTEAILENLTRHWAVWEDDLLDPNDFYSPRGLNAFLQLQNQGRVPQLVDGGRVGAFENIKDLLTLFDRDRQRSGPTDQEMGVQGGTADKTATTARILAAATDKTKRSMVKRLVRHAVLPQIKNLGMLSFVHGKPENLKFMSGDRQIQLGGDHLKWWMRVWMTDSQILVNDTITRDRNEEAMKATTFFQYAQQMVGQLPPDSTISILRYSAELSGIPQNVIDKALPAPLPVSITTPGGKEVALPSAAAAPAVMAAAGAAAPTQPPGPVAQPNPMQGAPQDVSMALPSPQ